VKRISIGAYIDDQGALHLSIPELLEAGGIADTPENRQSLMDYAKKFFAEQFPAATFEEVD
jgi:hypothetical protein